MNDLFSGNNLLLASATVPEETMVSIEVLFSCFLTNSWITAELRVNCGLMTSSSSLRLTIFSFWSKSGKKAVSTVLMTDVKKSLLTELGLRGLGKNGVMSFLNLTRRISLSTDSSS